MISNFRPDLLDFDQLQPGVDNGMKNMEVAFAAAEELGIAMLLDAEGDDG
jgi:hypothetical protein